MLREADNVTRRDLSMRARPQDIADDGDSPSTQRSAA